MLKYSTEILHHFTCTECGKWFSIASWEPEEEPIVFCPHCSTSSIPEPLGDFKPSQKKPATKVL